MDNIKLPNNKHINVYRSMLIPLAELKLRIIKNTELHCLETAVALWGENHTVTSRSLMPSDLGYPENKFDITSNSVTGQWNRLNIDLSNVPTATIIGIYGLKVSATGNLLPVNGIRVDVNSARIVQWAIYYERPRLDISDEDWITRIAVPIILLSENQRVTFYEYTRNAKTQYCTMWLGIVIEKLGITLSTFD